MHFFALRRLQIFETIKRSAFNQLKFHTKCHRIFSGIQPTGTPHLGNYFGAIRNWVSLQEAKSCIFCIVDLHSLTAPQEPHQLRQNIHLMVACLLACGINPDMSILFLQSQVPQHAELSWIFSNLVTMNRLSHLPQYKEKSKWAKEIPVGLFTYPVLQSADILLYKATEVPVGDDQLQHVQLCRHLAQIFNNKYQQIFPIPEVLLDSSCTKLMSLRQPDKKMSKSDPDVKSRIELSDSPDVIRERVKKSLTDFTSAVTYEPEKRPGVSNLILMHQLCSGLTPNQICEQNKHIDTGQYKHVVADAIIEHLAPIQQKLKDYLLNPDYLENVLKEGSDKASEIATETMKEVKEVVGLSQNFMSFKQKVSHEKSV